MYDSIETAPLIRSLSFSAAINHPLEFLLDQVAESLQLSPSRRAQAIERYEAVGRYLNRAPQIEGWNPVIFPQGSFRIGTTVHPWQCQIHDLDFVMQVDPTEPYTAADLYNKLYTALADSAVYKPMLTRKRRCVRITYANEFFLDILPAVSDPQGTGTQLLVPDRELKCFKHSNPVGFAAWFKRRSEWIAFAAKADSIQPVPDTSETDRPLTRAVQLMKRHRDVCSVRDGLDPVISIVITTLAATFYRGETRIQDALSNIVASIWQQIGATGGRLVVRNPTNPKEDFSERWDSDPQAYDDFRAWLNTLTTDLETLREARGPELPKTLERMFGEAPTSAAFAEQGTAYRKARETSVLGVSRSAGLVVASQAAATPVRAHTFHGD